MAYTHSTQKCVALYFSCIPGKKAEHMKHELLLTKKMCGSNLLSTKLSAESQNNTYYVTKGSSDVCKIAYMLYTQNLPT